MGRNPFEVLGSINPNLYYEAGAQQAQLEYAKMQMERISGIGQAAAANLAPPLADRARELFLKRMGGIRAEMKVALGDFLQCHIYGEVVHVFYCFRGRPGVTQESIDIFPSDTLIAQFRMILAS